MATQADAGSVHLAVTSVYEWDEFVQALQPAFVMDEKKALTAVLPSTQNVTEKFLDALQASLRLAPPRTSVASTATESSSVTGDDVESSSTSTTTSERAPGSTSNLLPTPAAPARRAADASGRDVSAEPLGSDPMLQHTSAAALVQEVTLLNSAVRRAALRYGYIPYVVRLQVTLMPAARDEPYDAYPTMSFFSGSSGEGAPTTRAVAGTKDSSSSQDDPPAVPAPYVIPLLVTDNLETSIHSRTDDVVRQLALALSVLSQGFAGDLGLDRTLEGLRAVVGRDFNSSLTLGRVSDNTVRIRLGAVSQVDVRHAMVPRTHNVSLVLLAPKELLASEPPTVRIASRTTFVDVETGKPLRSRSARESDRLIGEVLALRLRRPTNKLDRLYGNVLLGHAQLNDYTAFQAQLSSLSCPPPPALPVKGCWSLFHPTALWVDLLSLGSGSQYIGAAFQLPKRVQPTVPAQSVFLIDDTESEMTAVLAGVAGIAAEGTSAMLNVPVAGPAGSSGPTIYPIAARRVERGQDQLKLVFPSLASLKLKPLEDQLSLTVVTAQDRWLRGDPATSWSGTLKPVGYIQKPGKPVPADPGFVLRPAAEAIVPVGQKGALELYLDIGETNTKGTTIPTAEVVELSITGAEFALQSVDPAEAAVREGNAFSIKATRDCRMTLGFGNLREGMKIVVSATNKGTKVKHADVTVSVSKPVPTQP